MNYILQYPDNRVIEIKVNKFLILEEIDPISIQN